MTNTPESVATLNVVGAIIRRDPNHILLAQRPVGKSFGGQWEFPGGKVENGESLEEALIRECQEELGITISDPRYWCSLRHSIGSAQRIIHMDFFEINHFTGTLGTVGREGQSLKWVEVSQLLMMDVLKADRPVCLSLLLPAVFKVLTGPDVAQLSEANVGWIATQLSTDQVAWCRQQRRLVCIVDKQNQLTVHPQLIDLWPGLGLGQVVHQDESEHHLIHLFNHPVSATDYSPIHFRVVGAKSSLTQVVCDGIWNVTFQS